MDGLEAALRIVARKRRKRVRTHSGNLKRLGIDEEQAWMFLLTCNRRSLFSQDCQTLTGMLSTGFEVGSCYI